MKAVSIASANTIRRTSMTYPDATVLNYDYAVTTMDDKLSRVSKLTQSTTNLVQYTRLGLSRTVEASYVTQPAAFLTYIKQTGDSAPTSPSGDNPGDDYYGLDRFGRVQDQRWMKGTTDLERVKYGFDRLGNRNWRKNTVAATLQDEHYTYNNLYRVKTLDRGTLNGSYNGISGTPTWEEDWNFDPTGNWRGSSTGYLQKVSGTTTLNQNRTHNAANEITNITKTVGDDWPVPVQDAVGNLTRVPRPDAPDKSYDLKYDAWNRLVEVKPSGGSAIGTYGYDGLNRRATRTHGGKTWHPYYSDQWQVLAEYEGTSPTASYRHYWGLRYRDDLVLRDTGASVRHYALHDYFSVTAIVDTSGSVQERYGYDAFGNARFMNASFGSIISSSHTWETLYGAYRYDSESGLYQVRFRSLHPLLGRWTARDPIGESAGINQYAYVSNSPINGVDSLGLYTYDEWLEIIGAGYQGFAEGALATADGLIPFGDPFSGMYDNCDETLQLSKLLGQVAQAALIAAAAAAAQAALVRLSQTGPANAFERRLLYEIGQKTLTDANYAKYGQVADPVLRGMHLIKDMGPLGAILPEGAGWYLGLGKTFGTGPTPGGGWIGLGAAVAGGAGLLWYLLSDE